MRYGSICSGVEAATLAWEPLGWQPAFFAEVEPFPCAVLMQKFGATKPKRILEPDEADTEKERKQRELWQKQIAKFPEGGSILNLGDFTKITKEDYDGKIDLLIGGPPCQSYSCAGLRKGLDDPRGNLSLEFARLAYRLESRWFCLENVPGCCHKAMAGPLLKYYRLSADGKLKFLFSEERKTAKSSEDGRIPASLPRLPEDMGWHGELLTLSSCEWTGIHGLSLKDEGVSSLSEVLEAGNVPRRYFLTKKACEGILRRSEKRKRELPEALRQALAESAAKSSSTPS